MKAALGIVAALPLGLMALLGSLVITVPTVSDDQIQLYVSVAGELEVSVPWQSLIAVDGVRYRQDFSKVNRRTVQETANLFVACNQQETDHSYSWRMDFVGESLASQIIATVPGTIEWTVHTEAGEITSLLVDGLDVPVNGHHLEPGFYALVLTAVEVPAPYWAEIKVTAQERVCYGRPLEDVLDDLGFSEDDRYLVAALLNAFAEEGAVPFTPNSASPFVWPTSGPVTSHFGFRSSPIGPGWEQHLGIDIAADEGSPVQVAAAGRVAQASEAGNYGYLVRVDHGGFETSYAHLSWVYVQVGDQVQQGEVIGAVGNTGRSTGPHLHFEWRIRGAPIDPRQPYR